MYANYSEMILGEYTADREVGRLTDKINSEMLKFDV